VAIGGASLAFPDTAAGRLDSVQAATATSSTAGSAGCFCSVNELLRDAITKLSSRFGTIIVDGEAGIEQINRQVLGRLDALAVLTDGSARGGRTIDLLREIAESEDIVDAAAIGVVVNRAMAPSAQVYVPDGVRLLGEVPFDRDVAEFDATGKPLLGLPWDSPAYHAVWHIAEALLAG